MHSLPPAVWMLMAGAHAHAHTASCRAPDEKALFALCRHPRYQPLRRRCSPRNAEATYFDCFPPILSYSKT